MASQPGLFNFQAFTNLGDLAAGYRLYTYAPATTTQKNAFTDQAGTIPHTYTSDGLGGQYIALNARGELPAPLWLASGGYDLALKTPDGATVWTRRAVGHASADELTALEARIQAPASATGGASMVGFTRSTVAPANTVGRSLQAVRNITETGTVDLTGTTACSAAINTLISAGNAEWVFPAGTYLFDATVVVPDFTTLRFQEGATIKPSANGLVLFTSKDYGAGNFHSFGTQFWNPKFDANGRTGVVCFDMEGLRHAAGIYFPRFIGAFDHCIKFTKLCWDAMIVEPFAQGCVNGILIANGSNTVEILKPGIDGLGSAGYGIKVIGGAAFPTTTVTVRSGYVQGFSAVGGTGCIDDGSVGLGTYGTTFERVYFEQNEFADIYFERSLCGKALGCEFYTTFGRNGIFARNSDNVRVTSPLMSSGGRSVGLYNFDTSNVNCYADQTTTAAGINSPLGTVSGIGFLPTEDYGDFPAPGVVVRGATTPGTGATYSTRLARFHRIGRRVNINCQVTWSGWSGGTGGVVFAGIPAALVPTSYTPTGIGSVIAGMSWTGAQLVCYLNGTSGEIAIIQVSSTGTLTPLPMTAIGSLTIDLTYTI
jgi:hypothetical protein